MNWRLRGRVVVIGWGSDAARPCLYGNDDEEAVWNDLNLVTTARDKFTHALLGYSHMNEILMPFFLLSGLPYIT